MNANSSTGTVTLRDLWNILIRRLPIILLVVVPVITAVVMVDLVTYTPMYRSTAMLYILPRDHDSRSDGSADSDFDLALKVVNDCAYILKMQDVVETAMVAVPMEDVSYSQMVKCISISNPENTRILEVTVQAKTAEQAQAFVNKLCDEGAAAIERIMGSPQVLIGEYGRIDTDPCNKMSMTVYVLVGLLTFLAVYIVCLIRFLLDDGIHSEADVQRYLGSSVLGEIPYADARNGHRYGRRYGCKADYGYGYGYDPGMDPQDRR